jgi:hypothetical protein
MFLCADENPDVPMPANESGITAYFDLVRLTPLLERTRGRPEIKVGLIDGPVAIEHPDLAQENIQELRGEFAGTCALSNSAACKHGTFVAGILLAKRGSAAPAICPGRTLLVRSIFPETNSGDGNMPSATPEELARPSSKRSTVATGEPLFGASALLCIHHRGPRNLHSAAGRSGGSANLD